MHFYEKIIISEERYQVIDLNVIYALLGLQPINDEDSWNYSSVYGRSQKWGKDKADVEYNIHIM